MIKSLLSIPKIIITIIAICIILGHLLPRCDKEQKAYFDRYRKDFEVVNAYITENFTGSEKEYIYVTYGNDTILLSGTSLKIYPQGEALEAFFGIRKVFGEHPELDLIEADKDRICYTADLSNVRYVYSRNGKVPRYFFHQRDGIDESTYILGGGWYYMTFYHR